MKAITGLAKLGAVLGMAAVLSACGGSSPSASDVNKAMDAKMAKDMELMASMLGKDAVAEMAKMAPKVKIVSVKDCTEDDEVYTCSIEAKITQGKNSTAVTEQTSLRKDDSGKWIIL